jgi:hypothetical protein
MKLRRSARDIQTRNFRLPEKTDYRLDVVPAHHLCTSRTRFDVAVNAGQIAITAHVDLKDVDREPAKVGAA